MRSGGAVVASDIRVHREIYADAAEYFNPYAVEDLANAIDNIIKPANISRRNELVANGARVSAQYTQEAILPIWRSFLLAGDFI